MITPCFLCKMAADTDPWHLSVAHCALPSILLTVDLLNAGDTFSGTTSFDSCHDVADHQSTIIIAEAQGNVFKGAIVSKIRDQIRSRSVRGFFYVPGRQLIIVPDSYDSSALSLVCSYDSDSDNDANCKILTDYMSRSCGRLRIQRDRTGRGL